MNKEELCHLIADYEIQNGIAVITEEELLDLIPESELFPNLYIPEAGMSINDCIRISDYDRYLWRIGLNLLTGDFHEDTYRTDFHFIEDMDEIMGSDVHNELCWCPHGVKFEEARQIATIMDRHYLIIDAHSNIIGSGLFDVGKDINDFFRIRGFVDDYNYMKIDEPGIDILEWESALADEMEYNFKF